MTTPERLRRRQRIETALVGLLMVMVGASKWHDDREANRIEQCLFQQVTALTDTLTTRGEIGQRESDNTAEVLVTAARATDGDEIAKALGRYVTKREAIQRDRTEHPFKPFPSGRCEDAAKE